MISLDSSRGSKELLPYFTPYGVSVRLANLVPIGGDAWFVGKGDQGDINVAVERKRITDLIDSMKSNRLRGFQLPLMHENYDLIYIIVEGIYRPGPGGTLEEKRGANWVPLGVAYRQVDNFMTSLGRFCDGVKRSCTPEETVCQIVNLYRYYEKAHESRPHIYSPDIGACKPGGKVRYASSKPRWVEKFAYILPGLDKKLFLAADRFKTIRRAVNATPAEWEAIKGIGKVTAQNIQRALDSEGAE